MAFGLGLVFSFDCSRLDGMKRVVLSVGMPNQGQGKATIQSIQLLHRMRVGGPLDRCFGIFFFAWRKLLAETIWGNHRSFFLQITSPLVDPPLERFKISSWHWCNQNCKIPYSLQQRQAAATAFVERLEYLLPPDCPATLYERWSCAKGQRNRGCGMVKDVNWWPNGKWNHARAYHDITSHITNDRSIETIWHCFTWYLHDVTRLLKEFWQGDM